MGTDTTRWRGPRPAFVILDEAHEWATADDRQGAVGFVLEHHYPPGAELLVWPRQSGKRDLVQAFTHEGPLSHTARAALKPFFAQLLVRRDRTVHRLAHSLGLHPTAARQQFDQVQHVIEEAGVGDGYGQLTLTQPVRPPVLWGSP